jgi:hypothetical protein
VFKRTTANCEACPLRRQCLRTPDVTAVRQVAFFDDTVADKLPSPHCRALYEKNRQSRRPCDLRPPHGPDRAGALAHPATRLAPIYAAWPGQGRHATEAVLHCPQRGQFAAIRQDGRVSRGMPAKQASHSTYQREKSLHQRSTNDARRWFATSKQKSASGADVVKTRNGFFCIFNPEIKRRPSAKPLERDVSLRGACPPQTGREAGAHHKLPQAQQTLRTPATTTSAPRCHVAPAPG